MRGLPGLRKAEQQPALGKAWAFRRVHIFRPFVRVKCARAESQYAASQIGNWEGDSIDEKIGNTSSPRTSQSRLIKFICGIALGERAT